jgi:DNA-binding NarL/FixJ family response regulator
MTNDVLFPPKKLKLSSSINILIVDDHLLMLNALKDLLTHDKTLKVVGTCMSGTEAEQLYDKLHPDVVIMDVYMKPVSGIEATQNILQQHPEAKIVGLSNFYSQTDAGELSQSGAKGYIVKIASLKSIIECVKKVHAGELCFSENVDF